MDALHPWWPGGWPHPHLLFELLGYSVGFQVLLWARRRGDPGVSSEQRVYVLAAAVVGAALGSKLLFLLEDPVWTWQTARSDPVALLGGKTIVGGLLGGVLAVEGAKVALGIRRSTGDLFVAPLITGMVLGRIGCFLSGVSDGTHGAPTALPWGMDLGDGVPRHPAALYEIGFLLITGAWLSRIPSGPDGRRFRLFLIGYLAFRLVAEAWKTQPFPFLGLSAIQVACLTGLLAYAAGAVRRTWVAVERS